MGPSFDHTKLKAGRLDAAYGLVCGRRHVLSLLSHHPTKQRCMVRIWSGSLPAL